MKILGMSIKLDEIESVTFKRDGHSITVQRNQESKDSPRIKGFSADQKQAEANQ